MTWLWTLLTGSRLARMIGAAVMGALAILTFGQIKHRQGAQAQKAKQDAANARAREETVKEVLHETASDDPADTIRQRLRDRAKRKP